MCKTMSTVSMVTPRIYGMLLMTLLTYRITMVTISELSRKWQCLSSIALKIGHFRCTMSSSMQCLDLDVSEVAIFT